MQTFTNIVSQAIPLDMDNVDTDMIIPAQFLTKIDKNGYGNHLFQRLCEQDPDFIWNNPSYKNAEILVTKTNFGCGSSREHAVWALMQAGIRVVIAKSYSDIFYNNAAKNGLLLISLESSMIESMIKNMKKNAPILTVDLDHQAITISNDETYHFEFDPFHKECFLNGHDELNYLLEVTR
jgi:3-isopropylmalate/(R)-2-methylmalate dehydratase small subunit